MGCLTNVGTEGNGRSDVEGHEMGVREEFGEPRHYLAGRAVHAGEGVYLLTPLGGRYESSRDRDGELVGWFYFSLPGCGWRDFSIPVEPAMRLAWPDEVKL
ncbi:MAG: hypothetical protein M3434_01425 [Gemmatimonadota bacterium]|nr:hypothetical protein [Gemmatimonadota bacterium]